MAPRRLFIVGVTHVQARGIFGALLAALRQVPPVALPDSVAARLRHLLREAEATGAHVHGNLAESGCTPILVEGGRPNMAIAQEDIFAPVITCIEQPDVQAVLNAQEQCPFGLTASVFGEERECLALAARLTAGSVFVNDVIFPAADPRVPFSGRRGSGFGATQGAEGLLEMTAPKTVSVQRGRKLSHYGEPRPEQVGLLLAVVQSTYAGTLRNRMRGIVSTIREGRQLRRNGQA